jgi:hypothetical protein
MDGDGKDDDGKSGECIDVHFGFVALHRVRPLKGASCPMNLVWHLQGRSDEEGDQARP